MKILDSLKNNKVLVVLSLGLILMTGCVPDKLIQGEINAAGFFSGLWHGQIAPFSLALSFFNNKYSIYQSVNSGFTYDLGFYMAIISGFGTISLVRKKKKH